MSLVRKYLRITSFIFSKIKVPGSQHITDKSNSNCERVFWILMEALAFCFGLYVCHVQYSRYRARPTVVSLERDFHNWNGTLPSITFCYSENVPGSQIEQVIWDNWGVNLTEDEYKYYEDFLTVLLNADLISLNALEPFYGDPKLRDVDFLATIAKLVSPREQYVSAFERNAKLEAVPVITERGLCYTVNSVQSQLFALTQTRGDAVDLTDPFQPVKCNFVKSQCFIKLDVYGFNATISIHSPMEPIRYESFAYQMGHIDEITALYMLLETINDDAVRALNVLQRKCLFHDEPNAGPLPMYSVNLCLLHCRAKMAVSLCHCKPHFYPFIQGIRTCGLEGVECLVVDHMWPLNVNVEEDCDCPMTCDSLMFTENHVRNGILNVMDNGIPFAQKSSFRTELVVPRLRLRREVLFTFEDLLVSFGGAVTLFVGANFIHVFRFIWLLVECVADSVKRTIGG